MPIIAKNLPKKAVIDGTEELVDVSGEKLISVAGIINRAAEAIRSPTVVLSTSPLANTSQVKYEEDIADSDTGVIPLFVYKKGQEFVAEKPKNSITNKVVTSSDLIQRLADMEINLNEIVWNPSLSKENQLNTGTTKFFKSVGGDTVSSQNNYGHKIQIQSIDKDNCLIIGYGEVTRILLMNAVINSNDANVAISGEKIINSDISCPFVISLKYNTTLSKWEVNDAVGMVSHSVLNTATISGNNKLISDYYSYSVSSIILNDIYTEGFYIIDKPQKIFAIRLNKNFSSNSGTNSNDIKLSVATTDIVQTYFRLFFYISSEGKVKYIKNNRGSYISNFYSSLTTDSNYPAVDSLSNREVFRDFQSIVKISDDISGSRWMATLRSGTTSMYVYILRFVFTEISGEKYLDSYSLETFMNNKLNENNDIRTANYSSFIDYVDNGNEKYIITGLNNYNYFFNSSGDAFIGIYDGTLNRYSSKAEIESGSKNPYYLSGLNNLLYYDTIKLKKLMIDKINNIVSLIGSFPNDGINNKLIYYNVYNTSTGISYDSIGNTLITINGLSEIRFIFNSNSYLRELTGSVLFHTAIKSVSGVDNLILKGFLGTQESSVTQSNHSEINAFSAEEGLEGELKNIQSLASGILLQGFKNLESGRRYYAVVGEDAVNNQGNGFYIGVAMSPTTISIGAL